MTKFTSSKSETIKSDETYLVDNLTFLSTVFGEKFDTARPILVSFVGNPSTVNGSKWFGQPWGGAASFLHLSENSNNYFSLAIFKSDETGQYRRRKSHFQGLCAVMLDDIGSKISMERLTLPPSWLLETSPGNYQAGYLLTEPLTNSKTADQLINAIINAGLCDPGANGPTTRLARLPIAVNGKHEPHFNCRMEIWSPDRRYSVQELVDGLQLEIVQTERSKREKTHSRQSDDADSDSVLIPRPEENAVIAALRQRGLYKTPLGSGKHDITCPWKDEHTDAIDHGTAYFEPDDNWPLGGFKCLHGHCTERHVRDLLRMLDIGTGAARMKSVIRVIAGDIHRVVDAAEYELAKLSQFYQRGGLIVTVFSDPYTHETRIQEVSQPALVRALAGAATWERYDVRAKNFVRTDPPGRHATVLYDSNNYRHLPVLNGLARQPYLRPDGSLMTMAGYDSVTGMFGVFDASKFSIPDEPTREEAKAALTLLNELLAEFSFATENDKSAALAGILTAAIRPSLNLAPMFHVRAHAVGSGKSYLCELITAFATPQRGTPTTFPADDEECRKLLLAELIKGPAVVEFDNLTGDILPHKTLCIVLTSEYLSGRILGISKIASVNTRTLILSSGNNVGPIQDMTRRCITINLNPEVEIPAAQSFKRPNLIRELLQERERYVSAVLIIIRAWIIAGRQKKECKSLASYGEWSDLCRQSLLWLDCSDPATSLFEAISEDPDREILGRLLSAWQSVFGSTPTMIRDAVNQYATHGAHGELKEILHEIADERGEINRRKLGWWIKRHSGRIVNGMRFLPNSGNSSASKWSVESVYQVLSVSCSSGEESVNAVEAYRRASSGE